MANQRQTLFDQLINEMEGGANRFTPIEDAPTWSTGMRRPPIRANVQTGQLTLPMAARHLSGEVVSPSQLEGLGTAALPWERTFAGARPAAPPSFIQQMALGMGQPQQIEGQLALPRFNAATAYTQPAGPLDVIAPASYGTTAARNYGKGVQDFQRTGGATPSSRYQSGASKFAADAATNVGPAVAGGLKGRAAAAYEKVLGKLPESVTSRLPASVTSAAPAAEAAEVAGAAGKSGLLRGVLARTALPFSVGFAGNTAQQALGITDKLAQSKNVNPAEAFLRDATQGATIGGFFGVPGAIVGGLGAGLAGGLMESIYDDPNNQGVRQVLENTVGQVPVVGDIAHIFGLGAPEQAAEAADPAVAEQQAQFDMLVQSGFGSDAGDVERRAGVYDTLTQTGIDQDIAFEVAWGDTAIGQKVKSANTTASPFGDLQAAPAQLQQSTQPYVDSMRASAAALGGQLVPGSRLAGLAPTAAAISNSNAAAMQGAAAQYPYLFELQRRGKQYQSYADSVINSGLRNEGGGSGSDFGSLLEQFGINPEDLQQP